ncbi:MAG: hypothetical protein QOD38_2366 [Acidimicrobiaceae bacterium]
MTLQGDRLADEELSPGDKVEVRRRFDAQWARGFEVVEITAAGVRVRRTSDGEVLPADFSEEDVRPARKRANDFWWM